MLNSFSSILIIKAPLLSQAFVNLGSNLRTSAISLGLGMANISLSSVSGRAAAGKPQATSDSFSPAEKNHFRVVVLEVALNEELLTSLRKARVGIGSL